MGSDHGYPIVIEGKLVYKIGNFLVKDSLTGEALNLKYLLEQATKRRIKIGRNYTTGVDLGERLKILIFQDIVFIKALGNEDSEKHQEDMEETLPTNG